MSHAPQIASPLVLEAKHGAVTTLTLNRAQPNLECGGSPPLLRLTAPRTNCR